MNHNIAADLKNHVNPWLHVWFRPTNVAAWLRDNKPLYGVLPIILLTIALSLFSLWYPTDDNTAFDQTPEVAEDTDTTATTDQPAGRKTPALMTAVETTLLPLIILALLYGVGRWLGGIATLSNVLSAMAWSQLPVLVLTVITLAAQFMGYAANGPILSNEINFDNGVVTLTPAQPHFNLLATVHYFVSAAFFIWSFQILLYSLAEVESVRPRRALKILTFAFVALLLVQVLVSSIIGELNILKLLGLTDFIDVH